MQRRRLAGRSGEPNQVDNGGSWGLQEGNSGTGHLVEKALALNVGVEEVQWKDFEGHCCYFAREW